MTLWREGLLLYNNSVVVVVCVCERGGGEGEGGRERGRGRKEGVSEMSKKGESLFPPPTAWVLDIELVSIR